MKTDKTIKKDLYYTTDHEWIDFQGTVAYIGICNFKLTGFKEIEQVIFNATSGFKQKGDPIVTLKYHDFLVDVTMPVDGKIIETNPTLIYSDSSYLVQNAETNGWIARIVPAQPYERNGLLLPNQYQMNGKSKYAK